MSLYTTIEKQQQEIEAILKERIDLAQKERTSIRENLTLIDAKIKTATNQFAAIGSQDKRPRETIEQINTSISEMEYAHATTSQSKVQERELLKNLEKLRQKKKMLAQFNTVQTEVDDLKAKRTVIATELKAKDEGLEELHLGLRRVRTAMTLHVGISEVISHIYAVPEDRLPQVIGKGGSNLKQIETDYGVSIESERYGSNELNILGTAQAIQLAVQSIDTVVNTVAEEFTVSEQAVVCLTFDKGSLLQELQTRYNVRIEANRSKRSVKIVGLQSIVELAKKEIMSLQATREEITIELSILPSIVGKGGVVVRGIGEEHHVHIDINREDSKIVVMGLREGVMRAVASIRSIADENKEVEEIIQIEKQIMIGCVIGPNGTTIRTIQATYNVSLRTEKGPNIDTLHIVGTTARVLLAKQHVLQLMHEYSNNSESIVVPGECMPIILGKKGSRINALREEHSTVNIDVDDNCIRICGGNAEGRAKAKAVIADILASNWMISVPCEPDLGILLKSARGLDTRQQLLATLSLNVDIDTEHSLVKLRGYRENVEKGVVVINTFLAGFHTIHIDLSDEDCASLMNGSNPGAEKTTSSTSENNNASSTPMTSTATTTAAAVAAATAVASSTIINPESYIYSPTKYVEVKYGVEVHINRKECRLRLRGPQHAIQAAQANIYGILHGDPVYGSILVPIDPVFYATLIGKAGSNLRKMEGELNVKFDILKSKSLIRIRGGVDHVMSAKVAIIDFMDTVRGSINVNIPATMSNKDVDRMIEYFKNLYVDVKFLPNLQAVPKIIMIRGSLLLIDEAKSLVEEYISNTSSFVVRLPMQYSETHRFERAWKKIRESCSVELEISSSSSSTSSIPRYEVKLHGSVENVSKAKKLLYDALMTILPASTFVVIYMTSDQLKTLSSQKHMRDINNISSLEDLIIDRPLSCFRLMSSIPDAVSQAAYIIQQKIISWEKGHVGVGPVDGVFVWPLLVGKNNEGAAALEKQLNVSSLSFNRSSLMIDFECNDDAVIQAALTILNEKLDKIRSEHYELELEESTARSIVGKQGSNIAKFRSELQATIDLDSNVLKISGTAEQVTEAKTRFLAYIEEEKARNFTRTIYVPVALIPRLIGVKGGNIREIQQDTETKIDLDKDTERGTIRGSVTACDAAIKAIYHYFETEGITVDIETMPIPVVVEPATSAEVGGDGGVEEAEELEISPAEAMKLRLPPGAQPKAGTAINKNLSKSALKRLKKKEKQQTTPASSSSHDGDISSSYSTHHHGNSMPSASSLIEEESDDDDIHHVISSNHHHNIIDHHNIHHHMDAMAVDPSTTSESSSTVSSPIKESILAPIIPLSQHTSSAHHNFAVESSMINSTSTSASFMSHKLPSQATADVPISPSDSLLNILLGRTPAASAESAIFHALNNSKASPTAPTVIATATVPNTIQTTISSSTSSAAPSTTTTSSNQPVSSSQPAMSTSNQSKIVPPPGVTSTSAPLQAYYHSSPSDMNNSYNNQNVYNNHMHMHIQHQAQQPFFNPLAAAYAPMQSMPPGLANPYPSNLSNAGNAFPGSSYGLNDYGPSAGDFSFPMSGNMKSSQVSAQQQDYAFGASGRLNGVGGKVLAPPGLSMHQQHLQQQSVYMQPHVGNSNPNVGYYQAAVTGATGARPSYAMQMQQGFQQPAQSHFMDPSQAQAQAQYMQQQQQQQMLYAGSSANPNPAMNGNGEHNMGDDRGGGYFQRGGQPQQQPSSTQQQSKLGGYQMRL